MMWTRELKQASMNVCIDEEPMYMLCVHISFHLPVVINTAEQWFEDFPHVPLDKLKLVKRLTMQDCIALNDNAFQ